MNLTPDVHRVAVDAVMAGRHSVRAFLPGEVPRDLIAEILAIAGCAPSGTNLQPWRVHVLTGALLDRLVTAACAAYDAADGSHAAQHPSHPARYLEPYLGRRRKLGWDLYGLLGIGKTDAERMRAQHRKNFRFFGAPVGLVFSIDHRLLPGSLLDYGMFLQSVMLAARARGLDTCPQAAWTHYDRVVAEVLDFGEQEQLVCGMALGYADPLAVENSLRTERVGLDEFAVFHD